MTRALRKFRRSRRIEDALWFYADPETYFAIAMFPDPPCGEFWEDFSATYLNEKPGRRAREALGVEPLT